uniref:TATA box-binding protein-associated factor RNA polymerase I subunit B n=1 Tax=Globodera rostochiensis TaxID=31243 RepID=A0A914I3R1_GLORO
MSSADDDGGGGHKMFCEACGGTGFTLDSGFYYCRQCGEQSKGHRETEIEYQGAVGVNLKRSQKKAERSAEDLKHQQERTRKLRADPHLCERALAHEGDFPAYLDTLGTRLCTATKLVAKMANVLTDEPFRLPKRCVHFSQLFLFTYFREANIAFCECETDDDPTKTFCPLVKRTKTELMRMRRERETQAKEKRAQRRRERLEQSTVWEQLTRTFTADDNESDEGEDAGDVPLPEEEPISLFRRLNTALSIRSVNLAGVLYLGIDLLLCIVFMATQMAGARWVQLSDIFRWYREGRFTVSHSQLCALNFATSWDIDNGRSNAEFQAKRLTKRFYWRSIFQTPYYGLQANSESFRVLSFLTQFVGIPKSIQTAPFKDVLFRLLYNLNLPRAFERQLNALLDVLPPPMFTDYGALRLRAGIPMIEKDVLLERLHFVATGVGTGISGGSRVGYVTFLRYAFDEPSEERIRLREYLKMCKDRRRHVPWKWLPLPSELNAAALMLFALKMFFGLGEQSDDDDARASRRQPMGGGGGGGRAADVAENAVENGAGGGDDEAEPFNFKHWLLQLQLRMHCWQGTPAHVVLDKGFSACQLERSNTEVPYRRPEVSAMNTFSLGGSRLFHRHRKQAFAGCVPNMHRLFEDLLPNWHCLPISQSAYVAVSNEELYAPLQHQCLLNRALLDIVQRRHRRDKEQALVNRLHKRNMNIFFRNFYGSNLTPYFHRHTELEDEEQIGTPPLQQPGT